MNPESYIKNNNFIKKLSNNEIDIDNIAFLLPQDINKEHWQPYIDRQNAADEFMNNRSIGIKTDEYKCSRCKSRDCTYYHCHRDHSNTNKQIIPTVTNAEIILI